MKMLTKEEVALLLGLRPDSVRKMASNKKIPHYKLGHRILRFEESEIVRWIKDRKVIERPLSLIRSGGKRL